MDQQIKNFYDEIYKADHPLNYRGTEENFTSRSDSLKNTLSRWLETLCIASSYKVLEIGCGVGSLCKCHPNWTGLEYSSSAVQSAIEMFGQINIKQGDARQLPFESDSFDFVFSFAALEHVPRVEVAFYEIDRVLRPGGYALISPAWNCRPWTVKKLEIRPYSDLTLADKIQKLLIPIRKNLAFRAMLSLPSRLKRELLLSLGIENINLDYTNLTPDFSLNERFPHIADDDAFVSIDTHAALVYFVSRRYKAISQDGFIKRMRVRGNEIVVQKSLR